MSWRVATRFFLAVTSLVACSDAAAPDQPPNSSDASVEKDAGGDATPLADAGRDVAPDASSSAGVFVAVGYGGRTVRSIDDGQTWIDDKSLVANGGDDPYLLRTAAWAGTQFVALGWRRMTSPDGKTWIDHGPIKGTNWFGSVLWEQQKFVAVGGYGMKVTSPDGASWTDHAIDTGASHAWDGLAFGGSSYATTNDEGARAYSSDGMTWKPATGSTVKSTDMAFGNGTFIALGGTAVLSSTDGVTFQSAATLPDAAEGLVFAQGHFTAFGVDHVFTSPDGVQWTDHASKGDHRGAVAFGHGTYVRVGSGGRARSTDAITWSAPVGDGPSNGLVMLTFGTP